MLPLSHVVDADFLSYRSGEAISPWGIVLGASTLQPTKLWWGCVCVCMHCVRIALYLELLCLGRSPIVRIDVYMISIVCHPSLAVQLVYFLTDICVASMESRLGPYACLPHSRRFASQAWSLMPHVAGSVSTSHVSAKSWN
jgi:hypothetical protein